MVFRDTDRSPRRRTPEQVETRVTTRKRRVNRTTSGTDPGCTMLTEGGTRGRRPAPPLSVGTGFEFSKVVDASGSPTIKREKKGVGDHTVYHPRIMSNKYNVECKQGRRTSRHLSLHKPGRWAPNRLSPYNVETEFLRIPDPEVFTLTRKTRETDVVSLVSTHRGSP